MFCLSNALWDINGTLKHQRYLGVHSMFLKTLFVTLCCNAVIIWDKANICPHETFKCSWVISLLLSVSWCWFWQTQSHLWQKKSVQVCFPDYHLPWSNLQNTTDLTNISEHVFIQKSILHVCPSGRRSLLLVLFAGDHVSLSHVEWRGVTISVRRVLEQHRVVILRLQTQAEVSLRESEETQIFDAVYCDDNIRDLWRLWVSPCVVACGWGPDRSRWFGGRGPAPAGLYWTELQGPSLGSPSTEATGWSAACSECVSWKHTDTFQTCLIEQIWSLLMKGGLFRSKMSSGFTLTFYIYTPQICHILWQHDCKENDVL